MRGGGEPGRDLETHIDQEDPCHTAPSAVRNLWSAGRRASTSSTPGPWIAGSRTLSPGAIVEQTVLPGWPRAFVGGAALERFRSDGVPMDGIPMDGMPMEEETTRMAEDSPPPRSQRFFLCGKGGAGKSSRRPSAERRELSAWAR